MKKITVWSLSAFVLVYFILSVAFGQTPIIRPQNIPDEPSRTWKFGDVTLGPNGRIVSNGTGYMIAPGGTTAERPGSPTSGMMRWNSTDLILEWWNGSTWVRPGTGSGSVTSVDASGGTTGFSFSGGPVTGSGTLTLTGSVALGSISTSGAADGEYLKYTTSGGVSWEAGGGGGGAPTDATYITQTSNSTLSQEQALSGLSTGLLKVTTGTGVLSTASAGTDYLTPSGNGSGLTGLTATQVGLGNVTNESKATMFTSPTFTGTPVIPANTLELSDLPQQATDTLLGRDTAGTGNVEVITAANVKTLLSLNNVTNESKATMFTSPTFTGTPVIPDNSLQLADLPQMTADAFLGRDTTGTGNVESITAANAKAMLSLTAGDVGLGNVTNESKATMFTNSTFTGTHTLPDNSLQLADLPQMTADAFLGRDTTGTGNVETITASNAKAMLSLTASDVGLGNVTNESKSTMFTSPTFTGTITSPNVNGPASTSLSLKGNAADGASAVSVIVDSPTYANATAKLLSVRNNTAEKAFVDQTGKIEGVGLQAGFSTTTIFAGINDAGLYAKNADTGSGTQQSFGLDLTADQWNSSADINLASGKGLLINGAATTGTFLRGNGTRFVQSSIQMSDLGSGPSGTTYLRGDGTWQTIAGGGAPTTAKYIVQEADAGLSAEQSLGLLTTGLLKNTVSASVGTLSTATAGTDYMSPSTAATVTAKYTFDHTSDQTAVEISGAASSTYPLLKVVSSTAAGPGSADGLINVGDTSAYTGNGIKAMTTGASKAIYGYATSSSSGVAVYGEHTGSGTGVSGKTASGYAVQGECTSGSGGVYGINFGGNGPAIKGYGSGNFAVCTFNQDHSSANIAEFQDSGTSVASIKLNGQYTGQILVNNTPTNQTGSGVVINLTANEAQAAGDAIYINSSGNAQLADADAESTARVVGVCAAAVSGSATGTYILEGVVRNDSLTFATSGDVGKKVYLSTTGTTTNTLTLTAPSGSGDAVVVVGILLGQYKILVKPSLVITELT